MKRKASALWQGSLKNGKGTISSDGGALSDIQYSYATRFADAKGTNPEELIAAAHAACFSMALSNELGKSGLTPESIKTGAVVTLEQAASGFAITAVHLDVTAKVPGASQQSFEAAAAAAESGCPVSKVLKADISMDAKLEN